MNMLQVDIETNLHWNGIESARDMEETMRANRISNCISPCRRYLNSLKEIKVHYDATEVQGNGQCILNRPMHWQLPTYQYTTSWKHAICRCSSIDCLIGVIIGSISTRYFNDRPAPDTLPMEKDKAIYRANWEVKVLTEIKASKEQSKNSN